MEDAALACTSTCSLSLNSHNALVVEDIPLRRENADEARQDFHFQRRHSENFSVPVKLGWAVRFNLRALNGESLHPQGS